MLARRNRIVEADDFRAVVRRGQKVVTDTMIGYRVEADGCRVGIVVTAKTGNAVVRNALRRKTRAIAHALIRDGGLSGDVVFRFRNTSAVPSFAELQGDVSRCATGWGLS